ncbi:MAG TPA: helix-turn-helix transcriptional regulator [Candidatus Coprovicinus avistercoris]|uniref:Helix-turn-helix transcriptional regulator n=1 Tax=Candidatus Coprovicinus avistercoris TaxID=2840754 RepID=A0A9D1L5A3_9ACTN|nr:helix-turn-helix transcriptional regulator [Candidatus Coprovicinus avistercoris]
MTNLGDISPELIALFAPQVEQLGIHLERRGNIWMGNAGGDIAHGRMWLCAPSPYCLVLCHDVTPHTDMPLFEGSLGPYACACTMGEDAVACSRDCGLSVTLINPEATSTECRDEFATFVEHEPRSLSSHLLANHTYRSRSFIFLPDFFDELEHRYPGEFYGLFTAFGRDWSGSAELVIQRALNAIPTQPPLRSGGELGLLSNVTALIASLAASESGDEGEQGTLVASAQDLIAAAIERGEEPPSPGTIAQRLYVSRSKLCNIFAREVGMGVGTYARRLRLERAYHLLSDERLSIAEIAGLLGYPSPSAFSHAFSSAAGIAPRGWREMLLSD